MHSDRRGTAKRPGAAGDAPTVCDRRAAAPGDTEAGGRVEEGRTSELSGGRRHPSIFRGVLTAETVAAAGGPPGVSHTLNDPPLAAGSEAKERVLEKKDREPGAGGRGADYILKGAEMPPCSQQSQSSRFKRQSVS